jgi:hypothetical protein
MKNTMRIDERLNELIRKKISVCECNPCTCSYQKKDEYFQELKAILTMYNIEVFAYNLYKDHFLKQKNL